VWCEKNGYKSEKVKAMQVSEIEELVAKSPYYKATSNDIDWTAKVKMQGRMQKWVDHSISVTVNLPVNATEELVADVYKTAWEYGCKGVTVYRDGSSSGVLVSAKENDSKEAQSRRRSDLNLWMQR
jgi:ribonucleoside-diphosphate reductase alpha chain